MIGVDGKPSLSHTHSLSLTHTLSHTHTLTHSHTPTPSLTRTLTHTHTHTHTLTRSLTLSLTLTDTLMSDIGSSGAVIGVDGKPSNAPHEWVHHPVTSQPSTLNLLLLLLHSRTGPRRALSLKLSDTRGYEPEKRTRLGRNRELCTLLRARHPCRPVYHTVTVIGVDGKPSNAPHEWVHHSVTSQPSTLNPQLSTLNPPPSTLDPLPSTINHQPSTINPQPPTLNPQPSTPTPNPTPIPKPCTPHLKRNALNAEA